MYLYAVGKHFFWIGLFSILIPAVNAQDIALSYAQIQGDPFIQNFTPEDYHGFSQNWQVIQDKEGIIYVANNRGLLSYDGVNWQLYETKENDLGRAIMLDSMGRIFMGGRKEMGYFQYDSIGKLCYHSLLPFLPDSLEKPGVVFSIFQHKSGVYFCTSKHLFQWKEAQKKMEVVLPHIDASQTHAIDNEVYLKVKGKGFCILEGDSVRKLPGTELLKGKRVHAVIPLPQHQLNGKPALLIGTSLDGLYQYDGKHLSPFPLDKETARFFDNFPIYAARKTRNGDVLFANLSGGLAVLGLDGKLQRVFNTASGLKDALVTYAFEDAEGGIWCALSDGIAHIEAHSPFTYFGEKKRIKLITDVAWHQGHLYAAGETGIFQFSGRKYRSAKIRSFPTNGAINWHVKSGGDKLFAISTSGGFELNPQKGIFTQIAPDQGSVILSTKVLPPCLILGQRNGLSFYIEKRGQWINIGQIPQQNSNINTLVETSEGILWGGLEEGYVRLQVSADSLRKRVLMGVENSSYIPAKIDVFDQFNMQGRVFLSSKEPLFCNFLGLYRYVQGEFIQDSSISRLLVDPSRRRQVMCVHEDAKHRFWVDGYEKAVRAFSIFGINKAPDGIPLQNSLRRLEYFGHSWNIYTHPEVPDIAWMATDGGLVRYDLNKRVPKKVPFAPSLRKVTLNQTDLLKGGGESATLLQLPYSRQAFRFEFALPVYDAPERIRYRYQLEGFDKNWSKYSNETKKDYTNLPTGNYTFWVQARDSHLRVSQKRGWKFQILPPWYETFWAYAFFILLGGTGIYAFVQWRLQRLRGKNMELEEIIDERTQEIRAQKEQLEALDRDKARFFTRISHEFRTPLSIISGVVDLIPGTNNEKKLIRRNTENLLNLVNQILDLRKLESGKLTLNLQQADIVAYLKYIAESFESLAKQKDILVKFDANPTTILMDYDEKKILRIISNLLSNAIKFTPENGTVKLSVRSLPDANLLITIQDTGIGIAEEKLAFIFDHFYQVDSSPTRAKEGTGIGLTLVAELVKIMEGEIKVNSTLGKGTTFSITLPLRREAPLAQETTQVIDISKLAGNTIKPDFLEDIRDQVEDDLPNLLIVEDNPDVMQYLVACLQDDYNLSLAHDGQEGIEIAILQVPDIIISDVMMPRKDGFELCDTLKKDERTSHIPIVILTAWVDDDSRIAGLERGADAYLSKPFNQAELFVRLRKLLELRQKLQARYGSGTPLSPTNDPAIQQEDAFITKFRELITMHLDEGDYGTKELCIEFGVSRSQLYNKVKALTGRSVALFIRFIRLQAATEMLKNTDMTVADIAYTTGFSNPSYFSRVFSKEFGITPLSVRK